jgi:DNA-binding PadR family transcriptional regulator
MSAPFVLLGLLAAGAKHGYDLKHAYDATLPRAKPLGFGQVYSTLGRLERDGLVAQVAHDRDQGPERTTFALTEAGQTALDAWLDAIEPPAPHAAGVLVAKVAVALLTAEPARAGALLAAQRAAHQARLRELTRTKLDPASSLGDVIAADYLIAHLDADLRWLRTTLDRVAVLRREVRP